MPRLRWLRAVSVVVATLGLLFFGYSLAMWYVSTEFPHLGVSVDE